LFLGNKFFSFGYTANEGDAVDVIASRLRHLHYLRLEVLRPTLAALIETPLQEPRGGALRNLGGFIVLA
jgi:hypothetical protein